MNALITCTGSTRDGGLESINGVHGCMHKATCLPHHGSRDSASLNISLESFSYTNEESVEPWIN